MINIDLDPWRRASLGLLGRIYEWKYAWVLPIAAFLNIFATGMVDAISPTPEQAGIALTLLLLLYHVATGALILLGIYVPAVRFRLGSDTRPTKNALRRATGCRSQLPYFQVTAREIFRDLVVLRERIGAHAFTEGGRRAVSSVLFLLACGLVLLSLLLILAPAALPTDIAELSVTARGVAAAGALLLGVATIVLARTIRVRADPFSARRAFGYRLQAALFMLLSLLSFVAGLIVANLTSRLPGVWFIAFSAGLVLAYAGFLRAREYWITAGRLALPNVKGVTERDTRTPTLLLRSFADDDAYVPVRKVAPTQRYVIPFETVVAANLAQYGPPIAIARPKHLPTPGAAKEALTEVEWRERVLTWMREARLIVIILGTTPGVRWEIEQVINNKYLGKTILLIPPGGITKVGWHDIAGCFGGTEWATGMLSADVSDGVGAICLNSSKLMLFTDATRLDLVYSLVIDFAAYALLCRQSPRVASVAGA